MFVPRLLAALALGLAAVAALPADKPSFFPPGFPRPVTTINEYDVLDDGSWFPSGSTFFANLFAPLWRLFPTFADIGPKIIVDEDKFEVIVNVKDYKKEDLKVNIKGAFILVQGSHEAKHDERDLFASQFFHTYTLPVNASAADVTAELSTDGFLIVICPLNGNEGKKEDVDREVPIVDSGKPYLKEEDKSDKPTPTPTSTTDNDERREETTPASEREEITEKDNIIPHGTEPVVTP